MPNVTVLAEGGNSFVARTEPVYIIKEPVAGGGNKYIVTKAVWVYEESSIQLLKDGWKDVEARYDDALAFPEKKRVAVKLESFEVDGDGRPVQTQ
jgi:hypothetical protein